MRHEDARAALPAYWLAELPEEQEAALEEHLFDCDDCAAASEAMDQLVTALGERVPPTLTPGAIAKLEGRGLRLRHTRIGAGQHVTVPFDDDVDLLVHRLQQDLSAVERVDVELFDAATGAPVMAVPDLLFEPQSGELNLVCFRHYAEQFPPDARIRLVSVEPDARRVLGEYGVMHVLPRRR